MLHALLFYKDKQSINTLGWSFVIFVWYFEVIIALFVLIYPQMIVDNNTAYNCFM